MCFQWDFFSKSKMECTFFLSFHSFQKFSHLSIEVPFILIVTGLGVTNLYFYCFFGQSASDSFQKIPDCLYDFNWQMLPVHSQKHLILMIANAQRPIFYHAWGMAVLNLETFANVMSKFQLRLDGRNVNLRNFV